MNQKKKKKPFDYEKISDEEIELGRVETVKDKGFCILPSKLFSNVVTNAPQNDNLNETLAKCGGSPSRLHHFIYKISIKNNLNFVFFLFIFENIFSMKF